MIVLVAVFSPNAAWTMPRVFVERLRAEFPQHTFLEAWDMDAVTWQLPDSDAAFTAYIDREQKGLERLRWIQSPAAGVGHLLSTEVATRPIVLTSARGVRARAIAEHVVGVTLALAKQLHAAIRHQAAQHWALDELEGQIRTIAGMRMTIVGLGSIGQEVARLAAPIGFRVTGVRKRLNQPTPTGVEAVVAPEALDNLLPSTDVLVLSAPLTDQTRHLIGGDALNRIKRGALLVNVGRGKLIDDAALIAALDDGRLGGAALDVFTREPLASDSPYWLHPKVIVTPHISGAMEDYWTPLVALFSENLRRFERGETLINLVDKVAGY